MNYGIDVYTIEEAAKLVRVSKTSLYVEIRTERLTVKKVGRRTLITRSDLLIWLNSRNGFQPKDGGGNS